MAWGLWGPAACLCPGTLGPWVEREHRLGQGRALSHQAFWTLTGNPPPSQGWPPRAVPSQLPSGCGFPSAPPPPELHRPGASQPHVSEGLPWLLPRVLVGMKPTVCWVGSPRPVPATLREKEVQPSLLSGLLSGGAQPEGEPQPLPFGKLHSGSLQGRPIGGPGDSQALRHVGAQSNGVCKGGCRRYESLV